MQLYKIELKSRFYGSKPLFWPSVSIDCRLILKRIKMWFFLKCKVFSQNCAKTLHLNNSKVYTDMLGLRYFWIVQQALNKADAGHTKSQLLRRPKPPSDEGGGKTKVLTEGEKEEKLKGCNKTSLPQPRWRSAAPSSEGAEKEKTPL